VSHHGESRLKCTVFTPIQHETAVSMGSTAGTRCEGISVQRTVIPVTGTVGGERGTEVRTRAVPFYRYRTVVAGSWDEMMYCTVYCIGRFYCVTTVCNVHVHQF
jgi:hypothetical protein